LKSAEVANTHCTREARSLFPAIDAAVVVTPAASHFEICRELLQMGKDVFVEKPVSLVSSEAKLLAELAQTAGLIFQVGHIFRFDPASLWLRDAIAEGRFGRLKMLRAIFAWNAAASCPRHHARFFWARNGRRISCAPGVRSAWRASNSCDG
jgi:predicted dehydrogenase